MLNQSINNLLTALLDLVESGGNKKELLLKSKEISKLVIPAKLEVKAISDDTQDELTLDFGEKLFLILRGRNENS